jgi:serine/threonine protein kinase
VSGGGGLDLITAGTAEGVVCLKLSGAIDERFQADELHRALKPVSVLDLGEIRRITSFGVRQWSEAMRTLPAEIEHLYLVRCPPCFIDQLNMVINFGGRAEVVTASAIFFCSQCNDERTLPIDVFGELPQLEAGNLAPAECVVCHGTLELGDDPMQYLRFARSYGAKSVVPAAAQLLERTGLYTAARAHRPPEATKLVHGEVTLLQLAGALDARFQPRRLASGVEGHVVLDLGQVESIDVTGAQRLSELLGELSAASPLLVDAPPAILPWIADGRIATGNARLHSARIKLTCASCRAERVLSISSPEENAVCLSCSAKLSLGAATASLIERAFAKAGAAEAPEAVAELLSKREELVAQARHESGRSRSRQATRYRVIKPLSKGGMGEILLAVHEGIGGFEKPVALKKIRKELLQRKRVAVDLFLHEARLAANLSHPNIAQIFEVGEQAGDLVIAMEFIHGIDVRRLLAETCGERPRLPVEQSLYIAKQVALGLHHAHNAGDLRGERLEIVHRDVSPSNIMIGFDGQVKLVDFGVATATRVGGNASGLVGKCAYMSPEQVAGKSLDGRSDVFSLGVVLWELLAGRPLFRRESDALTTAAVAKDAVPSLKREGVPAAVEEVVHKALARPLEARYSDALSFARAIDECLNQLKATVTNADLGAALKSRFVEEASLPSLAEPSGSRKSYAELMPLNSPTPSTPPPALEPPKRSEPRLRWTLVAAGVVLAVLLTVLAFKLGAPR